MQLERRPPADRLTIALEFGLAAFKSIGGDVVQDMQIVEWFAKLFLAPLDRVHLLRSEGVFARFGVLP